MSTGEGQGREKGDFGPDKYKENHHDAGQRHIASNFSSSLSGSRVGDGVAERRANLLHAQGEPQIGRRKPAPPPDPRPKRIMYIKGILAGAVVVAIAIIIIIVVGANISIQ